MNRHLLSPLLILVCAVPGFGEVGDPQIRTDHPWYPGELAISTFDRLFATQAEVYRRVTGKRVETDHDKALASWLWRNTHYWHGEAGRRDLWGQGFSGGRDMRLREYWNGLFAYGFGLCGTTHSQWTAEFEHLLGHGKGRGVGAAGHNAFEVFLSGGPYGKGRWALLDHDLSTVIYDESGRRLLGLGEMQANVEQWIKRDYKPQKQNGWLVCGLHPGDGNSYRKYAVAEYLAGYAGPPPLVHLRRGEKMRRYFEPGLGDQQAFVFWGRNYRTDGISGPERSRTWVNQPDAMYGSTSGTPHRSGQARFANVQYSYRPNFANGDYRESVIDESANHVVIGFQTPYIIAAEPPDNSDWGIYKPGCQSGLLLRGRADCEVAISLDAGRTWKARQRFGDGLDLTDHAKGRSQYWIRFECGAKQLVGSDLEIRTVCQANVAVLPRLKDNGTNVEFAASGKTIQSLGPEIGWSKSFVTDGAMGDKQITLTAKPNHRLVQLFAAAHTASGSPPSGDVNYHIEYRIGDAKPWAPVVADWQVPRRGDEPNDFWSQSFCYGSRDVAAEAGEPIQIRFRNDGGKRFLRAEAHLVGQTPQSDPVKVTYHWTDDAGTQTRSHVFHRKGRWNLQTGNNVRTQWVQFEPVH